MHTSGHGRVELLSVFVRVSEVVVYSSCGFTYHPSLFFVDDPFSCGVPSHVFTLFVWFLFFPKRGSGHECYPNRLRGA